MHLSVILWEQLSTPAIYKPIIRFVTRILLQKGIRDNRIVIKRQANNTDTRVGIRSLKRQIVIRQF